MRAGTKRSVCFVASVVCSSGWSTALADRIVTKRGETFQGTIVEQTSDAVVFDSLAAGRVTIPRLEIDVLERTATAVSATPASEPSAPSATSANPQSPDELAPAFEVDEAKYLAQAGRPAARLNPLKGWKSQLNLGYSAYRGQGSDDRLEIRFRAEKQADKKEHLIESTYDSASTVTEDDVTQRTDQRFTAQYQFRRYLNEGFFAQSNTSYYQDVIQEILHEGTQTLGLGHRWRGRSWTFSLTPSIGVRVRDVAGEWTSLAVGGLLEDFEWRLTRTLTLRQSLEYLVAPDNFTDSSRRSWIELNQKLSAVWALNLRYEYTFDSVVGIGTPREQQRWAVTLGLEF